MGFQEERMKLVGLARVILGKWRSIQDQGSSGGLTWSIVLKSNLIWKWLKVENMVQSSSIPQGCL